MAKTFIHDSCVHVCSIHLCLFFLYFWPFQNGFLCVCATSVAGVSGKYFSSGKEESPSEEAMDKVLQKKVWELSETLVDLDKNKESNITHNH